MDDVPFYLDKTTTVLSLYKVFLLAKTIYNKTVTL